MKRYVSMLLSLCFISILSYVAAEESVPVSAGKGNPQVVKVFVSPTQAQVSKGEKQDFTAEIKDEKGNEIVGTVEWQVTAKIGTIDQSGIFIAGDKPGQGMVIAKVKTEQGNGTGFARVIVKSDQPADKVGVRILPATAKIKPGETQKFELKVVVNGEDVIPDKVSWTATKNIGIIDETGTLTAGNEPGRGIVKVQIKVKDAVAVAAAYVEVGVPPTEQREIRVIIRPRETKVVKGGTIQFNAEVVDTDGKPLTAELSWQVSDKIGTIDGSGLFTAGNEEGKGIVTVTAKANGLVGKNHAFVLVSEKTVTTPVPVKILAKIHPKQATVAPGETVQYKVEVIDPVSNKPVELKFVKWKVNEKVGTIDEKGLFTAGKNVGHSEVIVAVQVDKTEVRDVASVVVEKPRKINELNVKIRPRQVELKPLGVQQFELEVLTRDGEKVTEYKTEWRVPERLGKIDANGLFVAGNQAGRGVVTVKVKTEKSVGSDQAYVSVGVPVDRELPMLMVMPNPGTVRVGQSIKFYARPSKIEPFPMTATGNDTVSSAHMMPPEILPIPEIKWILKSEREIGTILPDGTFNATAPGEGMVIAESGQLHGAAKVIVLDHLPPPPPPPVIIMKIIPESANVILGESIQFNVVALNPEPMPLPGEPVPLEKTNTTTSGGTVNTTVVADYPTRPPITAIKWMVYNAAGSLPVGTISETGLFTATAIGEGKIIAETVGWRGTAYVRVVSKPAPTPTVLIVRPNPGLVVVGNTLKFEYSVSGDQPIIALAPKWYVKSTTPLGTIDETGLFVATAVGEGTIVVQIGTMYGTAPVKVTARTSTGSLIITPNPAYVKLGGTVKFEVVLPPDIVYIRAPVIKWAVRSSAGIGSIDETGLFTATAVGTGEIVAEVDNALHATALVKVLYETMPIPEPKPEPMPMPVEGGSGTTPTTDSTVK